MKRITNNTTPHSTNICSRQSLQQNTFRHPVFSSSSSVSPAFIKSQNDRTKRRICQRFYYIIILCIVDGSVSGQRGKKKIMKNKKKKKKNRNVVSCRLRCRYWFANAIRRSILSVYVYDARARAPDESCAAFVFLEIVLWRTPVRCARHTLFQMRLDLNDHRAYTFVCVCICACVCCLCVRFYIWISRSYRLRELDPTSWLQFLVKTICEQVFHFVQRTQTLIVCLVCNEAVRQPPALNTTTDLGP